MKTNLLSFAAAALLGGFTLAGTSAQAQNSIGAAQQQGRGAYVSKNPATECMTNQLLGLPGLTANDCVPMKQTKLVVTPSGNVMSVWKGTAPANARPKQALTHTSTWTETQNGVTVTYPTEAVTQPDGSVTLTLTQKKVAGFQKKK